MDSFYKQLEECSPKTSLKNDLKVLDPQKTPLVLMQQKKKTIVRSRKEKDKNILKRLSQGKQDASKKEQQKLDVEKMSLSMLETNISNIKGVNQTYADISISDTSSLSESFNLEALKKLNKLKNRPKREILQVSKFKSTNVGKGKSLGLSRKEISVLTDQTYADITYNEDTSENDSLNQEALGKLKKLRSRHRKALSKSNLPAEKLVEPDKELPSHKNVRRSRSLMVTENTYGDLSTVDTSSESISFEKAKIISAKRGKHKTLPKLEVDFPILANPDVESSVISQHNTSTNASEIYEENESSSREADLELSLASTESYKEDPTTSSIDLSPAKDQNENNTGKPFNTFHRKDFEREHEENYSSGEIDNSLRSIRPSSKLKFSKKAPPIQLNFSSVLSKLKEKSVLEASIEEKNLVVDQLESEDKNESRNPTNMISPAKMKDVQVLLQRLGDEQLSYKIEKLVTPPQSFRGDSKSTDVKNVVDNNRSKAMDDAAYRNNSSNEKGLYIQEFSSNSNDSEVYSNVSAVLGSLYEDCSIVSNTESNVSFSNIERKPDNCEKGLNNKLNEEENIVSQKSNHDFIGETSLLKGIKVSSQKGIEELSKERRTSPRKAGSQNQIISPRKASPPKQIVSPRKASPQKQIHVRKGSPQKQIISPKKFIPKKLIISPRKDRPLNQIISPRKASNQKNIISPIKPSTFKRMSTSPSRTTPQKKIIISPSKDKHQKRMTISPRKVTPQKRMSISPSRATLQKRMTISPDKVTPQKRTHISPSKALSQKEINIPTSRATPQKRKSISPSKVTPQKRKSISPSKVTPQKRKSISPSKVTPQKRKSISPSKVTPQKRKSISPSKVTPQKRMSISPNNVTPEKRKSISPCKVMPKKRMSISPSKVAPQKRTPISPSKASSQKDINIPISRATPQKRKSISPSKVTPQKRKSISPSKVTPQKRMHTSPSKATSKDSMTLVSDTPSPLKGISVSGRKNILRNKGLIAPVKSSFKKNVNNFPEEKSQQIEFRDIQEEQSPQHIDSIAEIVESSTHTKSVEKRSPLKESSLFHETVVSFEKAHVENVAVPSTVRIHTPNKVNLTENMPKSNNSEIKGNVHKKKEDEDEVNLSSIEKNSTEGIDEKQNNSDTFFDHGELFLDDKKQDNEKRRSQKRRRYSSQEDERGFKSIVHEVQVHPEEAIKAMRKSNYLVESQKDKSFIELPIDLHGENALSEVYDPSIAEEKEDGNETEDETRSENERGEDVGVSKGLKLEKDEEQREYSDSRAGNEIGNAKSQSDCLDVSSVEEIRHGKDFENNHQEEEFTTNKESISSAYHREGYNTPLLDSKSRYIANNEPVSQNPNIKRESGGNDDHSLLDTDMHEEISDAVDFLNQHSQKSSIHVSNNSFPANSAEISGDRTVVNENDFVRKLGDIELEEPASDDESSLNLIPILIERRNDKSGFQKEDLSVTKQSSSSPADKIDSPYVMKQISEAPRLVQMTMTDFLTKLAENPPKRSAVYDVKESKEFMDAMLTKIERKKDTKPNINAKQAEQPRKKAKIEDLPLSVPAKLSKEIFEHYAKCKLDRNVLGTIVKVSEKFWKNTTEDLLSIGMSRRNDYIITKEDVITLMTREGALSESSPLSSLILEYLPSEEWDSLIPTEYAYNRVYPSYKH